jgi:hypothetical protein
MLTLSLRNQSLIGLLLLALLIVTREQHFASLHNLPGASWAVFFLAGVYLRPAWSLLGLLAITWILDFSAYLSGGASDFCLTPAYGFLLPAYSALWLAGRWFANRYQFSWHTVMPLSLSLLVGATLCELFSSGGFYFISGRFEDPSWAEFWQRLQQYFPLYLESLLFYVGIAAVAHTLIVLITKSRHTRLTATS